jgi:alcohol dehydrogenase (cytochrome c)
MRTQSFFRAASLAATIWAGTALAGQDEDAGNEIFQAQCSACHSNQPGANGIGPSLAGVAGRKAGALAGFHFTPALQGSGLVWTADSFTQFLADPSKLVPGTAMTVTVPEATGRTALFTYLATLKDTTAATKPTGPALPKVMGPTQAELDAAASATDGWLYASHDYAGTRFVDLKQITPANARNVRPVCLYRSDQSAPVQTSPLVYQGVMYLTFGRATVAIDAKTCRERWTYIWQPKGQEISPANRGAAIKDGTLVRGTADGYLIALDMADGSLLWSQPIASFADHQYLSMPPLIFGDLVIVGPSGADFGAKNWVGAFKLATGEKVWKFNLIPDPGEPGAETWESVGSLKHGGGSLWTPLSLDAKAGIVYLPVGNPAPDFYGELRPGANLYTDSLVALDAKTGKLLWHRQFIPHDVHDADLSQVSPLFTTTIDGKVRAVVAVSGKDGLLRLIDRDSHDQIYEVPITTRENVDALPTVEGVHRCPGLLGGMEWNGPAYDADSNTLFAPAVDWCGTFSKAPKDPPIMQGMHCGVASDPREKAKGWLTAFDASTGKERWKYASPTPLVAGVTATSGGMLFTGDLNNDFPCPRCQDGRGALPFQHRWQHRRWGDLLRARRQAVCRGDLRNRIGVLCRLGVAGGRHLRRRRRCCYGRAQASESRPSADGRGRPLQRQGRALACAHGREPSSRPERADRFRHRAADHARALAEHRQAGALLQLRRPKYHAGATLRPLSRGRRQTG